MGKASGAVALQETQQTNRCVKCTHRHRNRHTHTCAHTHIFSIHYSRRDSFYLAIARCFVRLFFHSYHDNYLDYYSSSLWKHSLTWDHRGWVIKKRPKCSWICDLTCDGYLLTLWFTSHFSHHRSLFVHFLGFTEVLCSGPLLYFIQLCSSSGARLFPPFAMTESSCLVILWLCVCSIWLNSQKNKFLWNLTTLHNDIVLICFKSQ